MLIRSIHEPENNTGKESHCTQSVVRKKFTIEVMKMHDYHSLQTSEHLTRIMAEKWLHFVCTNPQSSTNHMNSMRQFHNIENMRNNK